MRVEAAIVSVIVRFSWLGEFNFYQGKFRAF